MNPSKPDSEILTPTSPVSRNSQLSHRTALFFGALIFICGIAGGVLITQFQRADGTLSVQQGLSILEGKATKANIDASTISTIWDHIHEKFIKQPIDDQQLLYSAIAGLVSGLDDPYSVYFNPQEATQFLSQIHGEFSGIGAEIASKKGIITVIAPIAGSPAEKAGVRAGDYVLMVDDVDVTSMSVSEVVDKIRGEKGSTVKILLGREGVETPVELSIVRDTIQLESVKWSILPDTRIAYIELSSFSDDTVALFQEAIGKIVVENPQGIILDVRNNPGGYLGAVVKVTSELLDKGSVVLYEQYADGTEKTYTTESNPDISTTPIVVLVNEGSASAAEILAGALKDNKRAVILGETTFGKGSVQDVKTFSDGSVFKMTIAHWLTPNKTVIQDTGVIPQYTVERTNEDFANDRDPQLDAATLFFTDRAAFDAQHTTQE